MGNDTNNSSLVLAFELGKGGKVLLFTGDAQRGNWASWAAHPFKDGDGKWMCASFWDEQCCTKPATMAVIMQRLPEPRSTRTPTFHGWGAANKLANSPQ